VHAKYKGFQQFYSIIKIKMFLGRYFHASAFLQDTVYVYGGLSAGSHYLQDFWKFNVLTRTWEDLPNAFKKKLAGHTMTVNEDEKVTNEINL
jgi:hypothetical protein